MIHRKKESKQDILLRQNLVTSPYESEAAKIYMKFLREHPDLNEDDVEMRIDSWEEEEDHYGHGGGYFHAVEIYTTREETDDEFNKRIGDAEATIYKNAEKELLRVIKDAKYELNCDDGDERCINLFRLGCCALAGGLGIKIGRDYVDEIDFPKGATHLKEWFKGLF